MARILTISEPGSVPPSRATVGPQAAESSPAAWVALASIGAGAGKITDWSIAGRIGEGQPVPRFGSVARSPLTGLGSSAWSVTLWGVLSSALRYITRARALGFYAVAPVPSHGANERLGQFLDTADVLRGTRAASLPVVKFVRARLAGLPGLARVAAHRVARIAVRVSEQVQCVFEALSHADEHGVRNEQCGQQKLRNGSPR